MVLLVIYANFISTEYLFYTDIAVRIRPARDRQASTTSSLQPDTWRISEQRVWLCILLFSYDITNSISVHWVYWPALKYFLAWQAPVFLQWAGLPSAWLSYCQTQHQLLQRLHPLQSPPYVKLEIGVSQGLIY